MIDELVARGWEKHVSRCGGCVAALLGTEIHVMFARTGVVRRQATREFLAPLFDRLGFLTTRTPVGDQRHGRFVRRLGFKHTWSDKDYDYFILTALPFSKGN